VSGYLIGSVAVGKAPLPPGGELQWWCQYYFAAERGGADTANTGTTLPNSSERLHHRNGSSMISW
jgi:hypothetical protein